MRGVIAATVADSTYVVRRSPNGGLAVEYAVWEDEVGTRVLVPTVHGPTVETHLSSGPSTPPRVWTADEWLAAFEERNGVEITNGARRLAERWHANEGAGFHVVASPGIGNNPAYDLYLDDTAATEWAPAVRILATSLRVPTRLAREAAQLDR